MACLVVAVLGLLTLNAVTRLDQQAQQGREIQATQRLPTHKKLVVDGSHATISIIAMPGIFGQHLGDLTELVSLPGLH